jgi:uncharacterized protein (DUF302 family)
MPQVDRNTYTLTTDTDLAFADAVARVREEVAAEGFGVLCEIDVQGTLKAKLGIEREPYLVLEACNPPLAHAALVVEPELRILLPRNVVVYQDQERTRIAAVDAEQMSAIVGNDRLAETPARCGGAFPPALPARPGTEPASGLTSIRNAS